LKIENFQLKNARLGFPWLSDFQFSISLLLLCFAFSCEPVHQPAPDDLYPVGDFSLTERNGETIRQTDLLGKIWVASFIFTRCGGTCPQISDTMAHIQQDLAGREGVMLVTFSVDPEHDRPEVLREYADRYRADPKRWLFLTGDPSAMYRLIREGFRLTAKQNEGADRSPGNEVMHDNRLVVVDRRGHIRGYIDGTEADAGRRIAEKVTALLREKS
jgi:cytochrome oxidase Cu insertion factor (SCO1/SenC/PrrC family)